MLRLSNLSVWQKDLKGLHGCDLKTTFIFLRRRVLQKMQFLEQKYYEDFIAKTVVGWKNSFQNFKTNLMVLCYTILEHNTQKMLWLHVRN